MRRLQVPNLGIRIWNEDIISNVFIYFAEEIYDDESSSGIEVIDDQKNQKLTIVIQKFCDYLEVSKKVDLNLKLISDKLTFTSSLNIEIEDEEIEILTKILEMTSERPRFDTTKVSLPKSEFLKLDSRAIEALSSFQNSNGKLSNSRLMLSIPEELANEEKKKAEEILSRFVIHSKRGYINLEAGSNFMLEYDGPSLLLHGRNENYPFPKLCEKICFVKLGVEDHNVDTRKTWKILEHTLRVSQVVQVSVGALNLAKKLSWILGLRSNVKVELKFPPSSYDSNRNIIEAAIIRRGPNFRYLFFYATTIRCHIVPPNRREAKPSAKAQRLSFTSCLRWNKRIELAAQDTNSEFYKYITILSRK